MKYGSAAQRREAIMARLRGSGFIVASDIAHDLGVSEMTVRRDLRLLRESEGIQVVRGGASLAARTGNGSFDARWNLGVEAKRLIAERACAWIDEGDAIALDAGTTAYQLARSLPAGFAGCVVTHSVPVLEVLLGRTNIRVIVLGGDLYRPSRAFAGPMTVEAASRLRVRTFFLGAAAIDQRGVYVAADVERSAKLKLMEVADRVILLADHSKFGKSAPILLCDFSRIEALVTDGAVPDDLAVALAMQRVRVETVVAEAPTLSTQM
jgi:DeoR/GlpR family transcriptional regulator of sugar metabolism